MSEQEISARIALAVGSLNNVRLFRNTTGSAWQGQFLEKRGDITLIKNARYTNFGLAKGSGDFIGLLDDGRFLSLEIKTETGRISPEQKAWLAMVTKFGGLAGIVRSEQEAIQLITTGEIK